MARNQKVNKVEKNVFIKNLNKIGYAKHFRKKNIKYVKVLTRAFQRRFRQAVINGVVDKECLIISENLTKNLNIFT